MNSTERARELAKRYCEAWRTGDLVGLIDCYSDDFDLHYFGNNPFSGDHLGRDAALDVLAVVSVKAPRTLLEIEAVLAGPDTAVIVARERIETPGGSEVVTRVLRYRIADGRFAECWLYEEDQAVIDKAWS